LRRIRASSAGYDQYPKLSETSDSDRSMAHDEVSDDDGDDVMTNDGATWEPLEGDDTAAARPPAAHRSSPTRRLRLRRSRNPVLAALDGGGDVWQRRGRDMLVGAVILIAPMVALNLWTTVLAFDRLDGSGPSLPGFNDDATTGIEEVALLLALLLASLTAAVVGIFAATILVGDRFGTTVGLRQALWSTLRLLPVAVAAWVVGHWWLPLVDAWVIGARSDEVGGRLFLALPVALVATSLLLYVGPVIVAERVGPLRALRRSWKLARMRFGSSVGFVASSTVLGALLLVGMASLPALLEWTGFITFGEYTWLANGIAAQLGVIITVPLVALATAQMYLEVRLDAEGMDLTLDTNAAFGDQVTAS
jgi:hypothetical protein